MSRRGVVLLMDARRRLGGMYLLMKRGREKRQRVKDEEKIRVEGLGKGRRKMNK